MKKIFLALICLFTGIVTTFAQWQKLSSPGVGKQYATQFISRDTVFTIGAVLKPGSATSVFSALFYSKDRGENWELIDTGGYQEDTKVFTINNRYHMFDSKHGIFYTGNKTIGPVVYSLDLTNGVKWTLEGPLPTSLGRLEQSEFQFLDRMNGIAFARTSAAYKPFGYDTVLSTPYVTLNGGKTWEPLPLYTGDAVQYLRGGKIINLYAPKDKNQPSILQISDDGGASFQDVTLPVGTKPEYRPYNYSFPTPKIGYFYLYYGENDLRLYKSTDGGYSWNFRSKINLCDFGFSNFFVSEDTGYSISSQCRYANRTTDGGLTWQGGVDLTGIGSQSNPGIPHFLPNDHNFIWTYSLEGVQPSTYYTLNGGGNYAGIGEAPGAIQAQPLTLYPNPATSQTVISLPQEPAVLGQALSLQVVDAKGAVVYTQNLGVERGINFSLNTSGFTSGVYQVSISSKVRKWIASLVVEK